MRWRLAPAGADGASSRRYRPGTLVLETEFETADGAVRVVDFMPRRVEGPPRLMRIVKGLRGRVHRQRPVSLSGAATRAIVRWERERARSLGESGPGDPLFVTLGRRRRDGSHARPGGRCGQEVVAEIVKRLGVAAELPAELRHPHALRHTCATELLRAGATIADVRVFLGHASVKDHLALPGLRRGPPGARRPDCGSAPRGARR